MLTNSWTLYHKAFATKNLRGFIERRNSSETLKSKIQSEKDSDDCETEMAVHRSRRPTSSDSGYDSAASSPSDDRFSKSPAVECNFSETSDDVTSTTHEASLPSVATCVNLSSSIGTQLSNVQLSGLSSRQLAELATLVSERGVVFFREQDLSEEQQTQIAEHFGKASRKHFIHKEQGNTDIAASASVSQDYNSAAKRELKEWVSTRSWDVSPPSYSILKAHEAGGDSAWVSQYGLYDNLSSHMKRFIDDLHVVHTSQLRPSFPLPSTSNIHPAVRTHPVTGLKALNVTPGAVTEIAQLSRRESDNLLQLLEHHANASDEHIVRFHWDADSVAIWDNRCTAFKHIRELTGYETSCASEKPYFDPTSESRDEKFHRLGREAEIERIKAEEIKKRYNDTPLRRILRRQGSKAPLQFVTQHISNHDRVDSSTAAAEPQPEQKPYVFRLRSNSEIREQEQKTWAQSETVRGEPKERQPLFQLRSASEMRAYEEGIWAKSTSPVQSDQKEEVRDKKRPATVVRVNSNGSPLRRIIQRQTSSSPGARRKDWR